MASLDDILSDEKPKEQEAPAPAEAPAPEPAEKPDGYKSLRQQAREKEYAAQGRDPSTGQYITKDEPKPEVTAEPEKPREPEKPPVQQFTEKERAFLAAAQSERAKRQELEKQLQAMKEAKTQEAPKSFFDDPEGTLKSLKDELQATKEEVKQGQINTRLQTSEMVARSRHTDFEEKVTVFAELVQKTPGLGQQWLAAPDPAEFAYQTAKAHKELQDAGGMESWRQKAEKEIRAKVEAELKAKAEALEKERQKLPPSLSDARGTTVNRPVWGGPTSLETILKS